MPPEAATPTVEMTERQRARRFVPPTLEEVTAYVRSRNSPVDPREFMDFYESKGWVVGKSPMKDWRAACRNAETWDRWNRRAAPPGQGRPGCQDPPDYDLLGALGVKL